MYANGTYIEIKLYMDSEDLVLLRERAKKSYTTTQDIVQSLLDKELESMWANEQKEDEAKCEECGVKETWSTLHKAGCSNIPY